MRCRPFLLAKREGGMVRGILPLADLPWSLVKKAQPVGPAPEHGKGRLS